jgi:hypothetical protein
MIAIDSTGNAGTAGVVVLVKVLVKVLVVVLSIGWVIVYPIDDRYATMKTSASLLEELTKTKSHGPGLVKATSNL